MKNKIKIWVALCVAACSITFSACDEDNDFEYNGKLSLNYWGIKQASEIWDGAQCNIVTALKEPQEGEVQKVKNFNYRLNLALYQNRKAEKDATVDLVIASDSLKKAIALVGTSSVYTVYADAELLPEEYYNLSASKMELSAGSKKSEEVELNVYSSKLIALVQDEWKKDVTFVLPVQIQNSTSYSINDKTNTMMFFFNVTYVDPGEEYFADGEGVPDDHELEGGYKLVWHDEFNEGTSLGNDWTHEVQGAGWVNNELQNYVNGSADGKRVTELVDGKLNINCFKGSDGKIYSGRVYAKVNTGWEYGYFEARIMLPEGKGTWPAFWMMPVGNDWNTNPWPMCGEIDIMEEVGVVPNEVSSSIHTQDYNHTIGTQKTHAMTIEQAEGEFHLYALEWTEDAITTYVDGKVQLAVTKQQLGAGHNQWPFHYAFYPILNLAWGGDWGGMNGVDESALPVTMKVDYVRVFQKK